MVTPGIAACLVEYNIQINVGRCLPQMWGFGVGRIERPRQRNLARSLGILFSRAGLDQAKLNRTVDSPPAAIDIEFAVNALGVSPHRT